MLDGGFSLGYGVQAFQQFVADRIGDGRSITGTRLERLAFGKDDIALPELEVGTARAHKRLGTTRLDS